MERAGPAGRLKILESKIMLFGYFCSALALRMDRRAVTAIEYAIIASLIAVVIVVAVTDIGTKLPVIFNKVSTEL
jgi:pilus assembly protein Flp/PilA